MPILYIFTWGTLATIALRQVNAAAIVVAWLRSALINVNLTAASRESSRAVALDSVAHRDAQTSMLTGTLGALNGLTLVSTDGSRSSSPHVGWALHAS